MSVASCKVNPVPVTANVGLVPNTTEPVPVLVVTPVPPANTGKVPAANALADVE